MRAAPTVVHGCRAAGNPCTIFDCSGAADVGSPMVRPHLGAGGAAPAAAIACFSSLPSPPSDVNMPEAAVVPERRGVHLWHEEVQLSAGFVGETESSSGALEVAPVVPRASFMGSCFAGWARQPRPAHMRGPGSVSLVRSYRTGRGSTPRWVERRRPLLQALTVRIDASNTCLASHRTALDLRAPC